MRQEGLMPRVFAQDTFTCNRFFRWGQRFTPTFYSAERIWTMLRYDKLHAPETVSKKRVVIGKHPNDEPDVVEMHGHRWVQVVRKQGIDEIEDGYVPAWGTTIGTNILLSCLMGYKEIVLLGMDGGGKRADGSPATNVGVAHEWARIVTYCNGHGVRLVDATPEGRWSKENVWDYVPLEEVLDG